MRCGTLLAATATTILSTALVEYGESTRWGAQIAPPMIPIGLNKPLYEDKPEVRVKRPRLGGFMYSYREVLGSGSAAGRRRSTVQLRGDRVS